MVAVGYIIYNTNLWIKEEGRKARFIGLEDGPPTPGIPTVALVKERTEAVFNKAVKEISKKKMKNLVIVNGSLSEFEHIQACVEVAEKYADNVMVIPPLLARISFALEYLAEKFLNPPKNEVIFVVTISTAVAEFVVLRRDQNFELHVERCEFCDPPQCYDMFKEYYEYYAPNSTILLVHKSLKYVANDLEFEFQPANCFIRCFQKWDYVLLFGGMCRARDDENDFDSRYHIPNFSSGLETSLHSQQRQILLTSRSPLPCDIHGYDGKPQMIELKYSEEYIFTNKQLVLKRRDATEHLIQAVGSSREIIGYVDERGVPYLLSPQQTTQFTEMKSRVTPEFSDESLHDDLDARIESQSSSSVFDIEGSSLQSTIKFLFYGNFYAVEVHQNGVINTLVNAAGHEKFPMFLSMALGTPEVGEKAENHCHNYPSYVVYDVLEVIGKRLNEIKINPKWGYKLVEKDDMVYFQVETLSCPLLISQELILAAFMKDMKLRADANLNSEIKEIELSTNFELSEFQKEIFKNAALKVGLKILLFVVNIV